MVRVAGRAEVGSATDCMSEAKKVFQAFGYFSETFQISQECGLASAGCGRGPHFVFACADLSKI